MPRWLRMTGGAISVLVAAALPVAAAEPVLLEAIGPVYPPAAVQAGIAGNVSLVIEVNETGKPVAVRILGETPAGHGFAAAAVEAALAYRFRAGAPGAFTTSIVFEKLAARDQAIAAAYMNDLPPAPMAVRPRAPDYPASARRIAMQGFVAAKILITETGQVARVDILAEVPRDVGFADAARAALFDTVYVSGAPGEYGVMVPFRLLNQPQG